MKTVFILSALSAALLLSACNDPPSSDDKQQQREETMLNQASQSVGIANITNFTEKALANKILELRDQPNLATFTYVQGIDGTLKCLGHSIGFGLPYSAQTTSSQKLVAEWPRHSDGSTSGTLYAGQMPQAEPNGLFMPDSAEGTWVILVDPASGKPFILYVEPRITVSPVALHGTAVSEACA